MLEYLVPFGNVSVRLGSEVSEVLTIPNYSSLCLSHACGSDVTSQLLLQYHAYLPAVILPTVMVMDSPSEM